LPYRISAGVSPSSAGSLMYRLASVDQKNHAAAAASTHEAAYAQTAIGSVFSPMPQNATISTIHTSGWATHCT